MKLDLIDLTEAGKLLGISRQQVKKYIDDGRIKAMTVGGRPFVERRHAKKPKPKKPGPKTAG